MSPREGHTMISVTVETRDDLDAIVESIKKAGKRSGVSRAYVVQQLATLYGPALVRHLTEPVRVGGRED